MRTFIIVSVVLFSLIGVTYADQVIQLGTYKYLHIKEDLPDHPGFYIFTLWKVAYVNCTPAPTPLNCTPVPDEILRKERHSWETVNAEIDYVLAEATARAKLYQELNMIKGYIPSPTPTPPPTATPTPFPSNTPTETSSPTPSS